MAVLNICTDNPNLSYIVNKNPQTQIESGVFKKNCSTYKSFSWFPDPKVAKDFSLYLSKIPNKNSDSFEYLDYSSTCNPELYLKLIQNHLSTCFKKQHEMDEKGFTSFASFLCLVPRPKVILDGINLEVLTSANHFKVTVTGDTIHDILNKICVWCYMQYQTTDYFYFCDGEFEKYQEILPRYTQDYISLCSFISKANSVAKHNQASLFFDQTTPFTFYFGNNSEQRLKAIIKEVKDLPNPADKTLLDLGAGEGLYVKHLKNLFKHIIAVEKDPDVFESLEWFVKKREIENTELYNQCIFDYLQTQEDLSENVQVVLCTEVLEHIPKEEASTLLQFLVDKKVETIILTVPNKDFNVYYGIKEEEIRHKDHLWEPTQSEFVNFIAEINTEGYDIVVKPLGNLAKSTYSCPTLLSVFTLKKVPCGI
jgi:hypothetical protein